MCGYRWRWEGELANAGGRATDWGAQGGHAAEGVRWTGHGGLGLERLVSCGSWCGAGIRGF